MKRFLSIILFVTAALTAAAQATVVATIDSIEILIGEQVEVSVKTTAKEGSKVVFPDFKPQQMITPGVEVVSHHDSATVEIDNGMSVFTHKYRITSFDGKLYYLPPFTVEVNGKQFKSKSLAIKVLEVPVDTTKLDQFYGPNDVQDNPFAWSEWSAIFWFSVLMLFLLLVAYWLYLRLMDNKPIIVSMKIVKKLLPHQKALKEIEFIKAEKMVTSENQKEYYTKLTETLRKYIQERYGFNAMEMTSSEIIARLNETQDQQALDELRMLFQTADLVKFAKYSTLINENDMNLVNAIEFINKTKQEAQPEQKADKPQLTEEQVRSKKTRRSLKGSIAVLAIAAAAILVYVVYAVYTLLI